MERAHRLKIKTFSLFFSIQAVLYFPLFLMLRPIRDTAQAGHQDLSWALAKPVPCCKQSQSGVSYFRSGSKKDSSCCPLLCSRVGIAESAFAKCQSKRESKSCFDGVWGDFNWVFLLNKKWHRFLLSLLSYSVKTQWWRVGEKVKTIIWLIFVKWKKTKVETKLEVRTLRNRLHELEGRWSHSWTLKSGEISGLDDLQRKL